MKGPSALTCPPAHAHPSPLSAALTSAVRRSQVTPGARWSSTARTAASPLVKVSAASPEVVCGGEAGEAVRAEVESWSVSGLSPSPWLAFPVSVPMHAQSHRETNARGDKARAEVAAEDERGRRGVLMCGVLMCGVLMCDVLMCDVLMRDVLMRDVLMRDVLSCVMCSSQSGRVIRGGVALSPPLARHHRGGEGF